MYRCRPMQIFLWRYKFSHGPIHLWACRLWTRQKYFCPPKIRPPIKVRPQFIDLPPYRPPPLRRVIGKLMPTITQRPCNPLHYRPSNFATDVVALWWNAIRPISSLGSFQSFQKIISYSIFLKFTLSFFVFCIFLLSFTLDFLFWIFAEKNIYLLNLDPGRNLF